MKMIVRRTLSLAADLVERGWCQRYSAVDSGGFPCEADSRNAVRFCAAGALLRAAKDLPGVPGCDWESVYLSCMHEMNKVLHEHGVFAYNFCINTTAITMWNDHPSRTSGEVAAKLREVSRSPLKTRKKSR